MNIKSIISLNGMCQSSIKWRLTDLCNYRCTYCVRKKMNQPVIKDSVSKNWQKIVNVIPEVARIIKELPGNVKLDLIGCIIYWKNYIKFAETN